MGIDQFVRLWYNSGAIIRKQVGEKQMKTRKTMTTDGEVKALNLRLPAELHRQLKAKAEAEVKSLNLVIVELIEKGFQTEGGANR